MFEDLHEGILELFADCQTRGDAFVDFNNDNGFSWIDRATVGNGVEAAPIVSKYDARKPTAFDFAAYDAARNKTPERRALKAAWIRANREHVNELERQRYQAKTKDDEFRRKRAEQQRARRAAKKAVAA